MAGNLPLSLVTVDDVVWDQLVQMDAPLGSPVSSTVAGVAPVQTWEYTEQVLPDIGDVDAKLLAAAGLSNTILISTTTAEVLETITVSIGENGNWFVGNTDTGVVASGTSPNTIARPTGMYRASLITQAGNLLTIAAGAQFVTSAGGQYLQFSTTADTVITLNTETTLLTIDSDGVIREYPASANLWLIPESEAVVAIAVDSAATVKTFVMPTVHNAWVVAGASRTFAELAQSAALTAESFATAAGNQAVAAAASASRAEEWASKPENSAITGNPSKYSALHWAMKAQQWASVVSAALIWKGAWSAAMNTAPPTPSLGTGAHFYRISGAGTISGIAYAVGDFIHWDTIALVWFKVDGTDSVLSVNGKTGEATLNAADVGAVPTSRTINSKPLSANIALTAADVGAVPIAGGSLVGVLTVANMKSAVKVDNQKSISYQDQGGVMFHHLAIGSAFQIATGLEGTSPLWAIDQNGLTSQSGPAFIKNGAVVQSEDLTKFLSMECAEGLVPYIASREVGEGWATVAIRFGSTIVVEKPMTAPSFTPTSDGRLKPVELRQAIVDATSLLRKLNPQYYFKKYGIEVEKGFYEFGFIADEVEEHEPRLVFEANDAYKLKHLAVNGIVAYLSQGFKELDARLSRIEQHLFGV